MHTIFYIFSLVLHFFTGTPAAQTVEVPVTISVPQTEVAPTTNSVVIHRIAPVVVEVPTAPTTIAPTVVDTPPAAGIDTVAPAQSAPLPITQLPPIIINVTPPTMDTVQAPAPVDLSAVTVELAHTAPADAKNDIPYGSFIFKVQVLDKDGKPTNGAPVVMDAPGNLAGEVVSKEVDTTSTLHSNDYYVQIEYIPTGKGPVTIHFTSGNLDKAYDLIVS